MPGHLINQFGIGPEQRTDNYTVFPAQLQAGNGPTTDIVFAVWVDSMSKGVTTDSARLLSGLQQDLVKTSELTVERRMQFALNRANVSLCERHPVDTRAQPVYFSALVLALTRSGETPQLQAAYVGNGCAWLLRGQQSYLLTRAHTWGAENDYNTEEDKARLGDQWYVPTRALGISRDLAIDTFLLPPGSEPPTAVAKIEVEAEDCLLLCTYRLSRTIIKQQRATLVQQAPPAAAQSLIAAAKQPPSALAPLILQWPRRGQSYWSNWQPILRWRPTLPWRPIGLGVAALLTVILLLWLFRTPTVRQWVTSTGKLIGSLAQSVPTNTPGATTPSTLPTDVTTVPTVTLTLTSTPTVLTSQPTVSLPPPGITPTPPTPTPIPVSTLASTLAPPPPPTNTPIPATPVPPPLTVVATELATTPVVETVTPPPAPPLLSATPPNTITVPLDWQVTLNSPGSDDNVINNVINKVVFTWSANFTPPAGLAFELIFWRPGQDPFQDGRGWGDTSNEPSTTVDFANPEIPQGEHLWGVQLVQTVPYTRLRYLGGERRIVVQKVSTNNARATSTPCPSGTACGS